MPPRRFLLSRGNSKRPITLATIGHNSMLRITGIQQFDEKGKEILLGITHTRNPQTEELTPIEPAVQLTQPGGRFWYWWNLYFQEFGRESPKNNRELDAILHRCFTVEEILEAMRP